MSGAAPVRWVLASRSPRREALLRAAGFAFDVRPSGVDERAIDAEDPWTLAAHASRLKAEAVAAACPPHTVVLGADTVVELNGEVFHQPADRADAERMLTRLAGRTHRVLTGVTLVRPGASPLTDVAVARVRFHPLDPSLVRAYVASGEADDKAGAYGIQGLGWRLVAAVEGDVTGVVGLPLGLLRSLARALLGDDPFAGRPLRALALAAFPDLARLPPACLDGIPD